MSVFTGFSFDKIIVIQSLGSEDVPTGNLLANALPQIAKDYELDIPVELINCESGTHFLEIIEKLSVRASIGEIPLLNIECHGDPYSGLSFKDNSDLGWPEVAGALLKLNIATGFNLMAVFSACFGFYFIEEMGAINPAPCWCLIAPTAKIWDYEVIECTREFYQHLFKTRSISSSFKLLSGMPLKQGRWICTRAEVWFEKLVVGYVEQHCSKKAGDVRIAQHYRHYKSKGSRLSRGCIKRRLANRNRYMLLGEYFERYFLLKHIPRNAIRFRDIHRRVAKRLSDLRATKKYYV